MDAKTRKEMYRLAEGFSMHAHKTGAVVRPVENLIDFSIDHLKQVADFTHKGRAELKKIEQSLSSIGLPYPNASSSAEVRANLVAAKKTEIALDAVMQALADAEEAATSNIERLQGVKTPLRSIIASIDSAIFK